MGLPGMCPTAMSSKPTLPSSQVAASRDIREIWQLVDEETRRFEETQRLFMDFQSNASRMIHGLCTAMVERIPCLSGVRPEMLAAYPDEYLEWIKGREAH